MLKSLILRMCLSTVVTNVTGDVSDLSESWSESKTSTEVYYDRRDIRFILINHNNHNHE